jgi:hypothetical protein
MTDSPTLLTSDASHQGIAVMTLSQFADMARFPRQKGTDELR